MKTKLITAICACIIFYSCVNDQQEVGVIDNKKAKITEVQGLDARASNLINRNDLDPQEIYNIYLDLSDVEDDYERLNSKNLALFYLSKSGFIEKANIKQVEYLIQDQNRMKLNTLTLEVNLRLYHRAIDLGTNMNLKQHLKSFRERNDILVDSYFPKNDPRRQQYFLSATLLQSRLNLINS
jgi:hypothetical protein